ncbi:O-antigen ligase family protein [bacterium]|nr:O-antigen ligase family protein [bacterium]
MAKLTEYLFYALIFLLPWQTVFLLREIFIGGEKWQYGTIGIYLSDVILVFWMVLVLIASIKRQALSGKQIQKNYKFDKNLYLRLLLATCYLLLTWSFISILWSADKTLAFYFSLKLLLGAGLFLALREVKINWRKIVFVFLAAAVLQSALAIGQFAFQSGFSSKWLGMNNYESWQGGVSVLENEGGRWLRAYGSLPHPNILGGYLTLAFIAGLYFLSSNYRGGINYGNMKITKKRANFQFSIFNFQSIFNDIISNVRNNKTKLNQIVILTSLLVILLGILLTFSRSAWLALAVGIIFLGVAIWPRTARSESEQSAKQSFIKLLLVFSLAGIVFASVNYKNFSTRFDAGKRLEQKSISERNSYFNQAREIIKENFWLGTGAGNYTLAVFQSTFAFASADKKNEIKKPIWQCQPVHNVFALIWAELGIVGLILFVLILAQIFLKSLKNKTLFCCLLFVVCCLLFVDHWLWTTHFGILLFWLIAGLAIKPKS